MLEYALKNTSVSKSGIYFNEPLKLNTFIQTFLCIVPKSSWWAITHYHQNSRVASEWEDALKGIRNKHGKTSKSTRPTQGAVRLEYVSPLETNIKNRGRYKKYSTHTLVYLFHMMGIMMLKVPQSNVLNVTNKADKEKHTPAARSASIVLPYI
ncbi:hypothetical protein [Photobacterium leiognathi]|uniref:hypothetical protein n=1 Tax=Photobacterium leiognathi TaxID=553611 RepID=UPI002738E2F3|nr:hypothetical protein [Photobacterium leiognathi]